MPSPRAANRLLHGQEAADTAQIAARQAFGGGEDWSAVAELNLGLAEIKLIDLVTHPELVAFKSKREARQRIEQGAVRLNGELCVDPNRVLTAADCGGAYLRLQAGKKTRVRVALLPS